MLTLASEYELLEATIIWLHKNGWIIDSISLAAGQGLPEIGQQKAQLKGAVRAVGIQLDGATVFTRHGPDIVAHSHEGTWKIECKGLGQGKPSTHRNNFDRAVASVMSYFDTPGTRLGLALANDYLWQHRLGNRLPRALREATNMWVFLLENGKLYAYEPADSLPFPGAGH